MEKLASEVEMPDEFRPDFTILSLLGRLVWNYQT